MCGVSKHTPGPWHADTRALGLNLAVVSPASGTPVANLDFTFRSAGEVKANAHLIAAAPDLLAALRMFYPGPCPVCPGDCAGANPPVMSCPIQMAGDALRKAGIP